MNKMNINILILNIIKLNECIHMHHINYVNRFSINLSFEVDVRNIIFSSKNSIQLEFRIPFE